ncbi:hypothetical protein ACHAWU_003858 [Discostella pseudostelligera]|uniref:DUF6824 domain-containing protein n=1 Tax=Discostella pseudostelligera TaxID=259834 RepID=A0ABD3MHJ6_9STRA
MATAASPMTMTEAEEAAAATLTTGTTATTPSINDVLLGRGNLINSHPGNQQYRALVDAYTQRYANAKSKKEKRAIGMQIYAEMEKLDPPVRFLGEGPSLTDTAAVVVDAAPPHDNEDSSSKVGSSSSHVNPALLNKRWLCVEPEKVLVKILHRLRERVQDLASVAIPLPQMNISDKLIAEQEITEQNGDYSAKDDSFDPMRIHRSIGTNPEITIQSVHNAFRSGVPFTEDWKLSNHQLQVYGVETSANQGTTEQDVKSSVSSIDSQYLRKYVEGSGRILESEPYS